MVIVPFTISAWFCDVTVYFHPLKVDVCPLTGKTYAKINGWVFPASIQKRQVPAKNNNKSSGERLNLVSFFLHGLEGDGCVSVCLSSAPANRARSHSAAPLKNKAACSAVAKPLHKNWRARMKNSKLLSLQCRLSHNANRENASGTFLRNRKLSLFSSVIFWRRKGSLLLGCFLHTNIL